MIITQNGRPAGVLISPEEFDLLRETKRFTESVSRGLKDSENGEVFTGEQLREELSKAL